MNNIIQSVQEGLSQILNPTQTFDDPQNQANNCTKPNDQTPTFNQHIPKIKGVGIKDFNSVKNSKLQ